MVTAKSEGLRLLKPPPNRTPRSSRTLIYSSGECSRQRRGFKGENTVGTGFGFASIAAMRTARTSAAAVLLTNGTQVLVTGGSSSDGPFNAELYDDNTGTWTPSEMTTARSGHTATLLKSGQVLAVGGDNSVDPGTAEVYSPSTNSWQKVLNSLNSPRIGHTATLLPDGRVLVTGGSGAPRGPSLSTAEIFDPGDDPVNGSWTLIRSMSDARALHTATLLPNGAVLVAGGTTGFTPLASAEVFDPATGIWSSASPMNSAHSGHTATLITFNSLLGPVPDFVVFVAGGMALFNSAITNVAELYQPPPPVAPPVGKISAALPAGGSWIQMGMMNVPRQFHTATLLTAASPLHRTFQVLVAGGAEPTPFRMTTEVFDSETGNWTFTGNMHSFRTGHTAMMLTGGKVLVAGGGDNSAEVGTGCSASAQIVVSPQQTIDFGQVQSGFGSNNPNFLPTVQNPGNALLTLTVAISGPDAALFTTNSAMVVFASTQNGPCVSGRAGSGTSQLQVTFAASSPVPRVCEATLTLGGSNAANVPAGQTWVFPMVAEIVVAPLNITIEIAGPSFPGSIGVGDTETGELVISATFKAVVTFPSPSPEGSFHWAAGDYTVGVNAPVSVPISFTPRAPGTVTEILELISNAQNGPTVVTLQGVGKKGITP
jgi:hypothetical protein